MLFAAEPRTLAHAAAASGIELRRLYHYAQKLLAAGLLDVVGTQRRAGRAMKLYRAVSESFFVSDELLPRPFTQSLSDELAENLLVHGFAPGRGMLFTISGPDEGTAERVDSENAPARVVDLWFQSRIRPTDLPALREALRAVVERFDQPRRPDAQPYILHAAAAPRLSAAQKT